MNEKRKDNKGRILRTGESQRADGMYMYRYVDTGGERRTVYSWRLVETDKLPPGKKAGEPLRETEKRLGRDADDGIRTYIAKKKPLNEFFDEYMAMRTDLKPTTRTAYLSTYRLYVRDGLGKQSLGSIRFSDIKKLCIAMFQKQKLSPSTVKGVLAVLHPVFDLAVRDCYIRINPCDGIQRELRKTFNWESAKRHALTEKQQAAFIDFVTNSPRYKRYALLFTFLLGTGCRIGEATGLRWADCDFKENTISVNHNLAYCKKGDADHCQFRILTPKTEAGTRIIPMLTEVREALLHERMRQMEHGMCQVEIDGYSGFIFMGSTGNVLKAGHINATINCIVRAYNKKETQQASMEHRTPELLPHFSVHNLRHTFCTRFCENETNLKIIQEIMGHADIQTTMDVYNEATAERKQASFANLEGKMKIS